MERMSSIKRLSNSFYQYPEHYHWSYKRFKANPALDNIYNIDPTEALKIVDRLKAEASKNLYSTRAYPNVGHVKLFCGFPTQNLRFLVPQCFLAEYVRAFKRAITCWLGWP